MTERTNAAELVATFSQEANHARRQWTNWLGIGSGGGVVALLSFAANLPSPDFALHILSPAITAFIAAIMFAGPTLLAQAEESASAAFYHGEIHNYEELHRAAPAEKIAAPPAFAERLNAQRNTQLARADSHWALAEKAWKRRMTAKWLRRSLMTLSALAFVFGAAYPLYLIHHQVPLVPATKAAAATPFDVVRPTR